MDVVVNACVVIDVMRGPERWSRANELVDVHVRVDDELCDDVQDYAYDNVPDGGIRVPVPNRLTK